MLDMHRLSALWAVVTGSRHHVLAAAAAAAAGMLQRRERRELVRLCHSSFGAVASWRG